MNSLRIRTKLIVSFLAVSLMATLFFVISRSAMLDVVALSSRLPSLVEHERCLQKQEEVLESTADLIEGFVLVPSEWNRKLVLEGFVELRTLMREWPVDDPRLAARAREDLSRMERTFIALAGIRGAENPESSGNQQLARIYALEDSVREVIDRETHAHQLKLIQTGASQKETIENVFPRLAGILCGTVAVGVGLALLLSRFIVSGLTHLADSARRIAKGDLDVVCSVPTRDEIGAVAGCFNDMVRELKATTVSRDALQAEVEQRRQAEAGLRESERNYRELFDASVSTIFVLDIETMAIQDVNERCMELLGYSPSKVREIGVPGMSVGDPEEIAKRIERHRQTVLRGGNPVFEWHTRRADGSEFWVEVRLGRASIAGQDRLLAQVNDITQRKKAEDELRRAKRQAEAAAESKGRFLANMSHEIRTPMTAVLGFSDLLAESLECCDTCPEHACCKIRQANKEHITAIRASGRHLLGIINDILDLSKVEAGKMAMDRQPTSLVGVVGEVASMMRMRAGEQGLELLTEFPTDLPETIVTDAGRLQQMLVNLVGNAVKFTERGSVTIRSFFVPQWRDSEPAVTIEVEDTGIGIEPDMMERLFAPFEQADTSTSRRYGGTGLGLAICRRVAEALDGELNAESEPGKGSTFRLTIPSGSLEGVEMLHNPSEALGGCAEAKGASHTPDTLAGIRILLAEDAEVNRLLISTVLRKAGAEVEMAVNGRQAVDMLEHEAYDVVLMDMQMPEMDGYDAARTLRKRGYAGPIIALTANAMSGDREKCLKAGCSDHVAKPIDRQRLVRSIVQWSRSSAAPPAAGSAAAPPPTKCPESIASEFADDPDMVDLIDEFVADLPPSAESMRQALAAAHWPELASLAHQLKGAGGGYGYPALTDVAKQLETAAKAADAEQATLAFARLTALIDAVIAGWPGVDAVPNDS